MAVLPIAAPTSKPGKLGLLSVAEEVGIPSHWEQDGVTFLPESCDLPTPIPLACVPSDEVDEGVYEAPEYGPLVTWRPFLTIGRDTCGYLNPQGVDREAAVRRHLEATESYQAEQEFMFLSATGGTSKENPGLFSSFGAVTVTGGTASQTVAAVDGALYAALAGQEGMLHISPTLAAIVADDFFVEKDGGYRTRLGNRVVVGSGYQSGTAVYDLNGDAVSTPVDGNVVFGTPMVYFTRGDIMVHGLDASQSNYRQNTVNVWAERPIILWASRCAVIGGVADLSAIANTGNDGTIDGGGA